MSDQFGPLPEDGNYCCRGECCGPGSWCCARAGQHEHDAPPEPDWFSEWPEADEARRPVERVAVRNGML